MKRLIFIFCLFPFFVNGQIISCWRLNGNANDYEGLYNGTARSVTWVAGKCNQAGKFVASSKSYIPIVGTAFNFGTTTFTVCFLEYCSFTTGINGCIVSLDANVSGGWSIVLRGGTTMYGTTHYLGGNSAVYRYSSSTTLCNSNWHDIVVIFTNDLVTLSNNNINIYIDGVLNNGNITKAHLPTQSSDSLRIGAQYQGPPTNNPNYFSGNIDELIIEQREWTATEIKKKHIYYFGFMQGELLPDYMRSYYGFKLNDYIPDFV